MSVTSSQPLGADSRGSGAVGSDDGAGAFGQVMGFVGAHARLSRGAPRPQPNQESCTSRPDLGAVEDAEPRCDLWLLGSRLSDERVSATRDANRKGESMSNFGGGPPVAARDGLDDRVRETARLWWLLFAGGAVSLVIGVLMLVWPSRTLEVIAILLGIELLLIGAIQIGVALAAPDSIHTGAVLRGAFAGIAGLIVIRHPGGSLTVVALAVGIYLVLAGAMRLVSAFETNVGRGWLLLGAALDLAIGVLIVAWPHFGVTSLAVVVGISLVLRGALESVSALALRSVDKALEGAE
jgi:uncharacterized membrane protein HdeD (DUF308 family)